MSANDLIQIFLSELGAVAILVLVLVSGARQLWVWGWTYDREVREKQEWRRIALSSKDLLRDAVTLAEQRRPPFDREDLER